MLKLGKKGRDKVTGFEGILIGHIRYLTGCDQYGIVPPSKDGKVENTQWFDEGRIDIIGEGITVNEVKSKRPGGPNRDAPR